MSDQATCGKVVEACICVVEGDETHEAPHLCKCGGSWEDRFGEFLILEWPGANAEFAWGTP